MNAAIKPAFSKDYKQVADNSQRDALIVEHLSLVSAIAAHIQRGIPVHIELDDLIHAGMMGLFDAATKFTEEKNVAFPTYAKHRIRGAILDSLRQSDFASRDLRKRYKQMEATTRELTAKLGRTPTEEEIAKEMGLNSQRWQALMVDFRQLSAAASSQLRASDREDDDRQQEAPAPASETPERLFARSQMRQKLSSAVSLLPERYRQVVTLYYERDMTMKEIGAVLGVNESRVSQMHKAALGKMQTVLAERGVQSAAALCA